MSTFATSVCSFVARPAALRTIALRRGRTESTTPSLSAIQSPTATSVPANEKRPGIRTRDVPAAVATSSSPR